MCAGAAVKSAWSNRFCLSGTTTSESNWKSGGDLERAVDSEKEKKKKEQKSNTVCSTVWQSRRVFRSAFNKVNGDFSPQAAFYCKSLIFARVICVIFTLFAFHFSLFSSSALPATTVPAAASHHFCFSMLTPCFLAHYPPQPPNAAVLNSSRSKTLFLFRAPSFPLMLQF